MKYRTYPSNKVRGSDKAFGAPKRVVEVSSMPFKLRSKTAVKDSIATTLFQEIRQERRRFLAS